MRPVRVAIHPQPEALGPQGPIDGGTYAPNRLSPELVMMPVK
jgi:hypothetical protein